MFGGSEQAMLTDTVCTKECYQDFDQQTGAQDLDGLHRKFLNDVQNEIRHAIALIIKTGEVLHKPTVLVKTK